MPTTIMTSNDLHEIIFFWYYFFLLPHSPHLILILGHAPTPIVSSLPVPSTTYVFPPFCRFLPFICFQWSKSLQLARTSTGFTTSVKVPWNSTVAYKYFVDGKWMLDETKPRMVEPEGYVNNVYVVPSKPFRPTSESTGVPNGDSDATALEKVT